MGRVIFKIIIALCFIGAFFAQKKGTIRGVVSDVESGEVLQFANASIPELNIGGSTNSRGYFIISSVPAGGSHKLYVQYVGYQTKIIDVEVFANKIVDLKIELSKGDNELDAVEKVGSIHNEKNSTNISLEKIEIRSIELMPKGVEADILRSLQNISGVQSTGDVSAKYYVRGSGSDKNLILWNGTTVYNPFHALGMFSVIDPEIINSVEFYKGGFTADMGYRLSSILNVHSKDGNNKNYSGKASASLLTGKVLFEGPIKSGSFIISGRKNISNAILKKFNNDNSIPVDFYDLSFKVNFDEPIEIADATISFHGFISEDKIIQGDTKKADYKWQNNIFGMKFLRINDQSIFSEYSIPTFLEIFVDYSKFDGSIIPNASLTKPLTNSVRDITLGIDYTVVYPSNDKFISGLQLKKIKTEFFKENSQGIISDIGDEGAHYHFYAKYIFSRYENFGLDIGFRYNFIRPNRTRRDITKFEPRVSANYSIFDGLNIKAAWGIYQQEMITVQDEKDIISLFEPWVIIPVEMSNALSYHHIAGLSYQFNEYMQFNVEAYYKRGQNIPTINYNKNKLTDPDFLSSETESTGLEFEFLFNTKIIDFKLNYTKANVDKTVNGETYDPDYDIENSIGCNLGINLGKDWNISFSWQYRSGMPFTKFIGFYDKVYFDDLYFDFDLYSTMKPVPIFSTEINKGRLPDYHRLDASINKKIELDFVDIIASVSVVNVYDRANFFYFDTQTGERVNMLPFLPTATIKLEF